MKPMQGYRPPAAKPRSPLFDLPEFAARKGVDAATMMKLFDHSRCDIRPATNSDIPLRHNRYGLDALERWWRDRPVSLMEGAQRLGTTRYLLKQAVAKTSVSPATTSQYKGSASPDELYRFEDLLRAWESVDDQETA